MRCDASVRIECTTMLVVAVMAKVSGGLDAEQFTTEYDPTTNTATPAAASPGDRAFWRFSVESPQFKSSPPRVHV
ncbi:hypothetical protein Aduo_002887 [Ancylostoma duodenale]